MSFNSLKSFSDAEYNAFINNLIKTTSEMLRASKKDPLENEKCIRFYLTEAYQAGLSISEAVDFFCVSSENIVELVSDTDEEGEALIKQFDFINNDLAKKYFK